MDRYGTLSRWSPERHIYRLDPPAWKSETAERPSNVENSLPNRFRPSSTALHADKPFGMVCPGLITLTIRPAISQPSTTRVGRAYSAPELHFRRPAAHCTCCFFAKLVHRSARPVARRARRRRATGPPCCEECRCPFARAEYYTFFGVISHRVDPDR